MKWFKKHDLIKNWISENEDELNTYISFQKNY